MNSKEKILSKPVIVFLLAGVCCLLWGSAFPCIKAGYKLFEIEGADSFSQILFAGIRFTLAGILTVAFGSVMSKKMLLPSKSSLGKISVLSLFQTILQYIFFYIGLAHSTGAKSSIINSISVFFSVIISAIIFKSDRLTAKKIIGCLLGFAGVVLINLTSDNAFAFSFDFFGEGFIILSSLSYAFSSVFLKRFSQKENPVMLSGYQFIFGGAVMVITGLLAGGEIKKLSVGGALLVFYLAFVSAAAYTLWGILLKFNDVSRVAVFGFMTPAFGCVLSALFLKEKLMQTPLQMILSLVLVCSGILIVNLKSKKITNKK